MDIFELVQQIFYFVRIFLLFKVYFRAIKKFREMLVASSGIFF